MKIAAIEITRHRIALDPPVPVSWDSRPRASFTIAIVRVRTDDGLEGVAAGDSMGGFSEHADLFLGQDPRDIERHHAVLDNLCFHHGRWWPLDIALWDLRGKIEGQPVFRLLGGAENRVRAYASTALRRDEAASRDLAQALVGQGFRAIKLRCSTDDWRRDIARFAAVRDAVGPGIDLMVDCNQGWRMPWDTAPAWELATAREVARVFAALDIYWMEEPLHRGDYAGMTALRAETGFRIAGGEVTRESHEFRTLIERDCLDVLQPDCVFVGGITGGARIAAAARSAGLEFTPHTWGSGLILLANAHLTVGVGGAPYLEFPFDPPDWVPSRRDFYLKEHIETDDEGWLTLPDRPGLGAVLDEDVLRETLID